MQCSTDITLLRGRSNLPLLQHLKTVAQNICQTLSNHLSSKIGVHTSTSTVVLLPCPQMESFSMHLLKHKKLSALRFSQPATSLLQKKTQQHVHPNGPLLWFQLSKSQDARLGIRLHLGIFRLAIMDKVTCEVIYGSRMNSTAQHWKNKTKSTHITALTLQPPNCKKTRTI